MNLMTLGSDGMGDDDAVRALVQRLRADPDFAILPGFHALKHALRFGAAIELALAADVAAADALAAELAPDIRLRLSGLLRQADPDLLTLAVGRVPHTGLVSFARRVAADPERVLTAAREKPVVLLENPRDLGNVGAVIRVAAAADAAAVLTTGAHDPWDPRAVRGSAGLHFALPILRVAAAGVTHGRPLVAVDPDGDVLEFRRWPPGAVLAFGTERHGLSGATLEAAEMRIRIPMRPGVSSMNLATAVAVVLFAGKHPAG